MAKKSAKSVAAATPTPGRVRRRYGRKVAQGEASVDPATRVQQAAPNFGRHFLPQIMTFRGGQSTISNIYRNPDEAIRHSIENARFMRNDCSIMESLEARQRATALLGWHLEPEDKKDAKQRELITDLTSILEEIERFTEYRRNCLEALWTGRTAIQNRYEWRTVRGKPRLCIRKWMPVHGDKLAFRFDDGSGRYDPDQIGIRVGGVFSQADKLAGDRKLEPTEWGQAYFLEPWERSLLTVHKHMIEDGAFEDPLSAGRVHGVGIRDRIYWCWFQKQETMANLMEVIERTGTGFTIYYYQYGNKESYEEMKAVAEKQAPGNVVLMPRMSGDPSMDAHGIERIEPSTAGIEALKSIIHEFFGWQIKRYILGQILSSESAATGLGSGVADLHQDTFLQIVQYDAVNLEETITNEVLRPLINFNFPWARDIRIKFRIDTKENDTERKLAAYKQAWDMGCRLKASDVMDTIGASMPDDDDEVLQNPSLMPQQDPMQQQAGDVGQDGGIVGEDGQAAEEGSVEDMFGPLAGLLGDDGEDGDEGGGEGNGGQDEGGNPPPGGRPSQSLRYAKPPKQPKSSPGQQKIFDHDTTRANANKWREELHPRDDGGQFSESPNAGKVPSSPGQGTLLLEGDAAEDFGKPDPFTLNNKPKPAKVLDVPPTQRTKQQDLFAGRGDAEGQTSFFDDIDPAAKNVADQVTTPLADESGAEDEQLERVRGILARIPKVTPRGIVVQSNGEISEEHAAELLDRIRGESATPAETTDDSPILAEPAEAGQPPDEPPAVATDAPADEPEDGDDLSDEAAADDSVEDEGQAGESSDEDPRESAIRSSKKLIDEDYAFARKSSVPNAGEDLLGSARHKRNAWKGLADAEANGTAETMVTRDNLLKNEPHNLVSIAESSPLSALAMHYTLRKFPAKPGYGSDRQLARRSDEVKKRDREEFHEAFQSVKSKAEELAAKHGDPSAAISEMKYHVLSKINKIRESSPSSGTANSMIALYHSLSRSYKPTSIAGQMKSFTGAAVEKYGADPKAISDAIGTHVQDIIEGKSLNHTFGKESTGKAAKFTPADLYVKHATREGGRVIDAKTVKAGTDYFTKGVGVRGIQYGNSVTDEERQHHLQKAAESFADLADATGLSDSDLSLGGKLGIAFGARGQGGALAHYEPSNQVINLTRKGGVGSLAHEWGHFFDHALADFKNENGKADFMSENALYDRGDTESPIANSYKDMLSKLHSSGFRQRLGEEIRSMQRSGHMGEKAAAYWSSTREVFARCFERYVQHKLHKNDRENTYLSGLRKQGHPLWPTDAEVEHMAPAFDSIFAAYKAREKK